MHETEVELLPRHELAAECPPFETHGTHGALERDEEVLPPFDRAFEAPIGAGSRGELRELHAVQDNRSGYGLALGIDEAPADLGTLRLLREEQCGDERQGEHVRSSAERIRRGSSGYRESARMRCVTFPSRRKARG